MQPYSTANRSPIQVALVEDDADCRQAFAQAIAQADDMQLAWQAGTLQQATQHLHAPRLDVLLVDLGLPDGSGLELIKSMNQVQPFCASMVSTVFGDQAHVVSAIEAGALGYLLKDITAGEMVQEIRNLHAGGSPISPMVARKLLRRPGFSAADAAARPAAAPTPAVRQPAPTTAESDAALSPREADVLKLVARGYTLVEVADAMGISRHTVRTFVRRIYQKLQASCRSEAICIAMQQGLLSPD